MLNFGWLFSEREVTPPLEPHPGTGSPSPTVGGPCPGGCLLVGERAAFGGIPPYLSRFGDASSININGKPGIVNFFAFIDEFSPQREFFQAISSKNGW
jgi:hypothetical protein